MKMEINKISEDDMNKALSKNRQKRLVDKIQLVKAYFNEERVKLNSESPVSVENDS